MKRTKLMSLIMAAALAVGTLTACAGPASTSSSPSSQEPESTAESTAGEAEDSSEASSTETAAGVDHTEPVELSFYISAPPINEQQRIMEKANVIVKEKLNATLNLIAVDPGTYSDKINLMISSGDSFDLCFMAFWGGLNFYENAGKGAFLDMTEQLPLLAPESYAKVPESLWKSVTVDDKIFACPNYQQWGTAARKGFTIRLDIAEEVGFDWKALKGKPTAEVLKSLETFFDAAIKAHPEMIGWETSSTYSFFNNDPLYWDMEQVGGDLTAPGWINYADPKKVINQFESPEFKEFCDIMREYYNKGYVRKDGATLQDTSPDRKAGKMLAGTLYAFPDDLDFTPTGVKEISMKGFEDAKYVPGGMSMTQPGEAPAVGISTTRTIMPATGGSNACTAINVASKNPERAMELMELLNTNDELFNLIQWGEEGQDYSFDEGGNFVKTKGKYDINYNEWQIGQSYAPGFTRSDFGVGPENDKKNDQKTKLAQLFEEEKTCEQSPLTGFNFNADPVKTELANCSAIITEMVPALSNGSVDPAETLPKFLKRLKDAGVDTIIAEKQSQYDAWSASK